MRRHAESTVRKYMGSRKKGSTVKLEKELQFIMMMSPMQIAPTIPNTSTFLSSRFSLIPSLLTSWVSLVTTRTFGGASISTLS